MCAQEHRGLSVAFVPYWGDGNPYQNALANCLSELGIELEKGRSLKQLCRFGVALDSRPDIIHLHWLPAFGWGQWRLLRYLVFVVRLVLLRIQGIPLVWTVHNLLPHESRHPRLDWLLARIVAGLSSGLIVHSPSAQQKAVDTWRLRDQSRFVVIPHGNYMAEYPNNVSRAVARERLALDESKPVLLFLGAVRPYKGVLELIEAFRQLPPARAVLVIAGNPLDDEFARRIETAGKDMDHVRFHLRFIPADEIQVYMNASDVVVLPYRHVLSSGATLLAMSFGRPCVAPAIGCLADVLDASGAFLYDPESDTGLLESMRGALENGDRLVHMGKYNRQKASQWTWEKAAEATRALYDHCLSKAGPVR